jgi:capsular polysaccharide biosynthesis protein
VLQGDFISLENGLMLLDNAGAYITINLPTDPHVAELTYRQANDPNLWEYAQSVRDHWDELPLIENAAIFSNIHHRNYYHLSMELIQNFRLSDPLGVSTVTIPPTILESQISRDMIYRALGERTLITTDQLHPTRLRNPVLVQAFQSDEAIRWLRKLVGKTAQPGGKRYYIRRPPSRRVRAGNNIAETGQFQNFLRRHNFIPIDFGAGDRSIVDQIDMLEEASVILSPHGAGLTNISYLNPPVRVIEIFGPGVISSSFIRISETLGLEHHAVVSDALDAAGDIVVDCTLLDRLVLGQQTPH